MNTFLLNVATPDGNRFDGQAVALSVRGIEGELMVMAGHIPFVTTVKAGGCTIDLPDSERINATLDGGILTVGAEKVTLLSGSFKESAE